MFIYFKSKMHILLIIINKLKFLEIFLTLIEAVQYIIKIQFLIFIRQTLKIKLNCDIFIFLFQSALKISKNLTFLFFY